MSVRRRLVVPAAAVAAAIGVSACGGEDDFENNPRPPSPIEMTARVSDSQIDISPSQVGGGPVNITVSNQSDRPVLPTLEGPTDVVGQELPPGSVGEVKATLEEGQYEVSAGPESDAREDSLEVGAERASSQNELLLP
jgi:hypothetical protein